MPVLDGYKATERIRNSNHPDAKSIGIIAMTANAFREDKERALKCGMNTHLAKPINVESLKDNINKYKNSAN